MIHWQKRNEKKNPWIFSDMEEIMKITKENFDTFIHEYEEDELFYRDLYIYEKEHPDTFEEYVKHLDLSFIQKHQLYVPALRNEPWFPYMDEPLFFRNIPGNIILRKHFRYTPVFVHQHEFFEILCIYNGTADVAIQGIQHQLHTGDVLIVPPEPNITLASSTTA